METYLNIPLLLAGAIAGFAVGLTGVGGGALMTPILIMLFGIAPVNAIGTDLWFAALTKIFTGKIHQGHNSVDWQILKRLWLGSLPAAVVTIGFMKLDLLDFNTQALKKSVAIVLLITVLSLLFQGRLKKLGIKLRIQNEHQFKKFQAPITIFCGGVLGFLVTLTSIGAGALGAVMLTYLYPFRLSPAKLIATDIIHAIPLAIFAGIGHLEVTPKKRTP